MESIPNSLSEITRMLAHKPNHLGLRAAYQSAKNKRNPRVASILLVGLTGAGKSSTLNTLFDNKNLADVGDSSSCSSDIIEYEIEVPVSELSVNNTILRIIDTPGFGDTRNPDLDAQLIATLKNFFQSPEDFNHDRFSTAVLIVANFTNNRFDGETSAFAKMLKGLQSMEKNIFDKEKSNTILLLTHFMSAKPTDRKNFKEKCNCVATVVHQFTQLPTPITTILGENEGSDYDLPEENGYFKLPNEDYYPYNLFNAIQQIADKAGDIMGEAIIRTAFKNIKQFQINKKVTKLLPAESPLVKDAINIMNRIHYNVSETQVTTSLSKFWQSMNESTRNNNPGILECLQRVFIRKGINSIEQLPKTVNEILMLMKEMPTNSIVSQLLEQALGMKVPTLTISPVAGQCYNIINDSTTPVTIFQFNNKNTLSPIGYLIPSEIKCDIHSEIKDVCQFVNSYDQYINCRLKDLNVIGKVKVDAPGFDINVAAGMGYNMIQSDATHNLISSVKITSLREYRQFCLTLASDIALTSEFKSVVNNLPKFNLNDSQSVSQFQAFFQRFGTHVVISCFGGGAIEIEAIVQNTGNLRSVADIQQFAFQVKADFAKKFGLDVDSTYVDGYQSQSQTNLTNVTYSAHLRGGDIRYHVPNLVNSSKAAVSKHVKEWIESLTIQPLMLKTNMRLVPLSYYVRMINKNAAENIELASQKLLEASLNYTPPPPPPPPPPRTEVQPPPQSSGGCLKAGTLIMLSDGRELPVEMIRSGDMILDIDLKPCKVIGINHMLMDGKKFYGFSKANYFFTGGHIFVRNKSNEFFVVSKAEFLKDNPFIDELDVVEVQPEETIQVMKFKNDSDVKYFIYENVKIYKDETEYDVTIPIYFLIVESETGTYIANGYVCRHELPTFERWPNTLACLQKIFVSNIVKQNSIGGKLSPFALRQIEKTVDHIVKQLEKEFSSKCSTLFNDITNIDHESISTEYTMGDLSSYLKTLTDMIQDNYWSTFGMLIYGRCGNFIRNLLDHQKQKTVSHDQLADFIIKSIETFSKNN